MREGKRAGRRRVVVHVMVGAGTNHYPASRVGLVVSKAVGGSVVRHSVSRKLRHVMRPVVTELPTGTHVVLRALGAAATATSAELDADIRSALVKLGVAHPTSPA